jgi:hypothetical protein
LTAAQLYASLGRWKAKARGELFVAGALERHKETFTCDRLTGRWYLCDTATARQGSPAESSSASRGDSGGQIVIGETSAASHLAVDDQDDPRAVDRELRQRLIGRRLIAEVGLDEETYHRVEAALGRLLRGTRNLGRIAQSHPALLATYLVAHGVYRYEAGNFYGSASLPGIDQSAGPAFMSAVNPLGLESFEDLVVGDNALRYVGPMLAHGGIPKYCLEDFFNLLLRDMERVGGDATELLSFWRTRKSAFFGIDVPVRRFLLYGGELARDVLDRSIDMVREYARSGTLPRSADIGLPPYIVEAFRRRGEKTPVASVRGQRRVARPQVSLDPWSTGGPHLLLPPVPVGADASWRILADGLLDRVRASPSESRHVRLNPAKAWTVTLTDGASTLSETSIEGMDDLPALFFDPVDGLLLGPGTGLRLDDVWVLAPQDARLVGVDPAGETTPLPAVQQLPDPTGAWSGFVLRHLRLRGVRAVSVRKSAGAPERRVTVRPPAERARIVGAPIPNVAGEDGSEVFAELPEVALPHETVLGRSEWRIRLAVDGNWDNLDTAALPCGAAGLRIDASVATDRSSRIGLVVQGPLGADLRVAFVYVPGLEVNCPERVILPGDRHGTVSIVSPSIALDVAAAGERVTIPVADREDTVRFMVEPDGPAPLFLTARVPKLMWGVQRSTSAEVVVANRQVTIAADELRDREATALMVRTGIDDLPLSLALLAGPRVLQATEPVRSSRGGRWVFDLTRFADTAVMDDSPLLDFRLDVAGRHLTPAHVRRSLHVGSLRPQAIVDGDRTTVEVDFEEDRPVRNRVVRLWSCGRPWEPPVVEPIPDGQGGRATLTRYDRLPTGTYLAELAVDDGWTAVTRPARNAPGVADLHIGTPEDIKNRLWRLSLGPPLNVVEFAAATGLIPRLLTSDELAVAMPALLDVTADMLNEPGAPDLTSGRFTAIRGLLLADTGCFADAVVGAFERGRLDSAGLVPLAVALGPHLAPPADFETTDLDASVGALWEVGPCLAAGLDITEHPEEARAARFRRYLAWDPSEGVGAIHPGGPVEQVFVGMTAETLEAIALSIRLVPDRVLTLDSLVQANFEWLLADKHGGAARRWWKEWEHLLHKTPEAFGEHATVHLGARHPPAGTEAWAGLPSVTLAAALHLLADTLYRVEATRALLAAVQFAPLLIARDLVLARVLLLNNPARQTEA